MPESPLKWLTISSATSDTGYTCPNTFEKEINTVK